MENLDLFEARRARDEGIARVTLHNESWLDQAIRIAHDVLPAGDITGEYIRYRLIGAGLPRPTNPNAWGALVRTMTKRGMLIDTGRSAHATDVKSHACRVPIWSVARG